MYFLKVRKNLFFPISSDFFVFYDNSLKSLYDFTQDNSLWNYKEDIWFTTDGEKY